MRSLIYMRPSRKSAGTKRWNLTRILKLVNLEMITVTMLVSTSVMLTMIAMNLSGNPPRQSPVGGWLLAFRCLFWAVAAAS